MRPDVFEALAPVCPRCRMQDGTLSPLRLVEVSERRAGQVWMGLLNCSNAACWMEFPILDGIPILVPNPAGTLEGMREQVLLRQDLPASLVGLVGDATGSDSAYNATRLHLSLYGWSHFSDWVEGAADAPQIPGILAVAEMAVPEGPVLDVGCGVGRGVFEVARGTAGPVLGVELNLAMLRLAQTLMLEGEATFGLRRVGMVYDPVTVRLPADWDVSGADFWAADCLALPFGDAGFAAGMALNVVDCIGAPAAMLAELARALAPGAPAVVTTPYDWSGQATDPSGWLGGHSQRGPNAGASEPVLRATLAQVGLPVEAEAESVPWYLRMHARAVMQYALHVVRVRRAGD